MSSATVVFNNLIKREESIYIDPLSKAYLIGDVVIGVNRLVLFDKMKRSRILLGSAYSMLLCSAIFYTTFVIEQTSIYSMVLIIETVQYFWSALFNMLIWKRLKHYYQKLQEFDTTMGCRPKKTTAMVINFILMCVAVNTLFIVIPYDWIADQGQHVLHNTVYMPVRLLQIIHIHFYGHLLSLLVPRLRLINYYMKISLSDHKGVEAPKIDKLVFKSVMLESQNCQMTKLMDFYCLIISAYDILIDAIKWQFVAVLTSVFMSVLSFAYVSALHMISGKVYKPFIHVIIEMGFTATRILPLFAPCVFADQILEEVTLLRENIAFRLNEDKLNKAGRGVARALLSLTEARDLSFSLLQMFNIDISLPFKFVGMLLTYLIILLQFDKVINA